MSDIQGKSVQELIAACSICKKKWSEPTVLPCLHIYCQDCFSKQKETCGDGLRFDCSKCVQSQLVSTYSTETKGGKPGSSLDKSVTEVAQLMEKQSIPCTSCDSGKAATVACSNCGDFLCEECESSHKRMRLTREHKLVSMQDLSDVEKLAGFQKVRYGMCLRHNGQMANLFCETDGVEVCQMCTYEPEHNNHSITTIDTRLQDIENKIDEKQKDISSKLMALKEQKEIASNVIDEVAKTEEESLKKFGDKMREFNDMIVKCENDVTERMKCTSQTQQQELRKRISQIEEEIEKLSEIHSQSTIIAVLPVSKALKAAQTMIATSHETTNIEMVSKDDLMREFPGVKEILPSFANVDTPPTANTDLPDNELCLELEAGYDGVHESMSILSSVVQSITENRDAPSTMMGDSDQELTSLFYQDFEATLKPDQGSTEYTTFKQKMEGIFGHIAGTSMTVEQRALLTENLCQEFKKLYEESVDAKSAKLTLEERYAELEGENRELVEEIRKLKEEMVRVEDADAGGDLLLHENNSRMISRQHLEQLKESVHSLETELSAAKKDHSLKVEAIKENKRKFAQLLSDHHGTVAQLEQTRQALEAFQKGGRIYQQTQTQVDNLTAQLMAADESMLQAKDELSKLKRERDAAGADANKYKNLLPVLKAQCDVYKNDFEVERAAREKVYHERDQLKEEVEELKIKLSAQNDEVQRLSDAQLQMIHERHTTGWNLDQQDSPRARPASPTDIGPFRMVGLCEEADSAYNSMKRCPKCNQGFSDIDTLQRHCMDCIQ